MNGGICDTLNSQLGALYTCAPVNGYQRIRTPFLYPDGDVIDVFVDDSHPLTVSDMGETLRWLRMQSLSNKRSPKQEKMIQDICMTHGLEFYKGQLNARVQNGTNLAETVMRVAQGSVRVADLWFTMRTRSVESVNDEVSSFFDEVHVEYQRGQKTPGRSGTIWSPDFHTRTATKSSLIYVLSTGSKAAAKGVSDHVVAAWYDLSAIQRSEGVQLVSLFDDTLDVWTENQFKLLEELSIVARWSNRDEFADVIGAEAA